MEAGPLFSCILSFNALPFLDQIALGGATKHLKVLEGAGLITKGRDAQWRPCTLDPEPLKGIANRLVRQTGQFACRGKRDRHRVNSVLTVHRATEPCAE